MKRSLSMVLVFAMVLSLITVIPVSAAVSRAVWDFTDGTLPSGVFTYNALPTKSEEWAVVTDDATTQNDITLGNYVKTDYSGTWPNFYWSPGQTTLADGQTMELEFDMKVENYASDFQFRFDGTAAYRLLITTGGALKRRIADTTAQELTIPLIQDKSLTHPGGKGWNRYKIVFQGVDAKLSDAETTHKAIKLTGFYLNGVNQIDTTAASFASQDPAVNGCLWAAFDSDKNYNGSDARKFTSMYLTFKGVAGGVNEVLSFDNLSKTTYAEGDTAPAERGELTAALRRVQASYNTQYAESGTDADMAEYFESFQNSIDTAWAIYQDTSADQTAIDSAIDAMEIFAIVATEPNWLWNDDLNTDTTANYTKAEGSPVVEHDTTTFADDVTVKGVMKVSKSTGNYPRMAAKIDSADKRIAVDSTAASVYGRNAFAEFEYDLNISELWDNVNNRYITFVTYLQDTTVSGLSPFSIEIQPNGTIVYGHHDRAPAEVTVGPTGVFDYTRTNRLKLIVQLTDAEGNATQRVEGIYLNGEKLNDEAIPFTNINPDGDTEPHYITRLGFYPNKMANTTGSYYIDNVRICTYNKKKAEDPSQVLDDYDVVKTIRTKYEERNTVAECPSRYTQEVQDRLAASIAALEVYYTNGTGDKNALFQEAEYVTAALKAANIVTVYDADPGNVITGDGVYGITDSVTEVDSAFPAAASFSPVSLDASYGESAYVLTEFEVKTEDFADNSETSLAVSLKDGSTEFAAITLTGGEHPFISLNDDDADIWYSALEDGQWMTIRLLTQITDNEDSVINENIAFFINGNDVMLRTSEDPGRGFKAAVDAYDSLSFALIGSGTAYVDNVRVIKYYGTENTPVNYGQLLTSIRKGDAKLANAIEGKNVKAEIKDAYVSAQNKAKAVAEADPAPSQNTVDKENDALCQAYAKFLFANEATEIGSVSFRDAEGNETAYITAGGLVSGVSVIKKAEYDYNGVVMVGLYDVNGVMLGCSMEENVLTGAELSAIAVTLTNPLTIPEETEGLYVKAVIWDTISNMRPLAEPHIAVQAASTIYIAGDSIVQTYDQKWLYPRNGWGAYVADYYTDNISQNNLAISGYTLRSYIEKGKMKTVEENMKAGDYFFVSFMANDSSFGSPKRVELLDYKNLLRYYGEVAQRHGAQVVYVTSPAVLSEIVDSENCYGNGAYPEAMRAVAAELGAPLVDVYAMRKELQREKGYDYVESAMYMCNKEAIFHNFGAENLAPDFIKGYFEPDSIDGVFSTSDKTHISVWGAKWCASKIAESLQTSDCGLRYSVNSDSFYTFPADVWTASAQ